MNVQPFLFGSGWVEVLDGNDTARAIFKRHYSCNPNRDPDAKLIIGPGFKLVLLLVDATALCAWRKEEFRADGQTGVECCVYRHEGQRRASELLVDAMDFAWHRWPGERLFTFVDPNKVRPTIRAGRPTWGHCFYEAGCTSSRMRGTRMNAIAPLPMPAPTRPALRYHGGKWRLAPWIIAHFPPHRVYVEPFGGAGSVLLRKPRSYAEIYNDLDAEVVGLFAVLRDRDLAAELQRQAALTPYARAEFELSYKPTDDPLEKARRLLVCSWMAHGSSGLRGHRTGFRLGSMREHTTPNHDWAKFPDAIPAIVERLQGVAIECRPAERVIAREDRSDTLIYVDPPYMFATRSQKRIGNDLYHGYRHELDDAGHRVLLEQLRALEAMVIVSGYATPLYDGALAGWTRVERDARADRGEARTEVLWINPAADRARKAGPLFSSMTEAA